MGDGGTAWQTPRGYDRPGRQRRASGIKKKGRIGTEREKKEQGECYVGFEKKEEQGQDIKLEQINEMLSDALSLLILLENDMEIQKSDGIHARILKMIHGNLKGIQKELSAYMRQEEE